MKQLILFFLATCFSCKLQAQAPSLLVTPQWVFEHRTDPDVIILQVNFLKYDYDQEHIAGARHLWPSWLAPDSPTGNFNQPTAAQATETLRTLGVNQNSTVVLCHRNEVTVTARMFLTLENLGLRGRVYFLNGGLEAWKKAGYPVTSEAPTIKRGNIKVKPGDLLVDKNYVLDALKSDKKVVVDARAKKFYDGDPTGNPRDGHITGAQNIPYPDLLDAAQFYQFKTPTELQELFAQAAPDKSKEIVTYCFIGQTASVVYMAGRLLGYEVKLYDGSLQEWSRLPELPMEKTVK
jgi:thiosulfate/3-mercaptopyruvate sulfurtransferase